MTRKSKRIEVVSPNIKCYGENVSFKQLLEAVNTIKFRMEFKDHEIKLMNTKLPNCSIGIVITGQNKDLPPKRNNKTGEFYKLNLDVHTEKLSFGNIFLYDDSINILFYELNINGCYLNKLAEYIQNYWNFNNEDKVELSFTPVSRKGEYERMMRMGYYKEFYVELTNPTEIMQDYNDNNSSLFSTAKRYIKNSVNNKSDVLVLKFSTHGRRTNKFGLFAKEVHNLARSFGVLLVGEQRKNVKKLKVTGYFTDPNDPQTLQPINLVSDVFSLYIKLTTHTLHSDLQEGERKSEIEKLYQKHLPELKYIFNRQ